ncbi:MULTISPECIES: hypothetical protein [unclassified Empedobacter]|uniref:hypothetical protein n=1 Tax=unclassified Empedobacter TaxID=2643773 RepID=UPI0025BBD959|nr:MULTISPECIES: hypothetical protein [unclassified Empedobacter]
MNVTATPISEIEVTEIDQNNLSALVKLSESSEGFKDHANAVSELFFSYVEHCKCHNEEIEITTSEIYCIREVINFLNKIQFEKKLKS